MQLSNTSSPDHTGYQSPFLQPRNTHFEAVNFHDAIQSLKAPLSARQRQKFFKEAISETLTWAVRCFAGIASEGKSILCIPLQVTALESVTAILESVTATLLSSRLRLEDSLCLLGIQDVQRPVGCTKPCTNLPSSGCATSVRGTLRTLGLTKGSCCTRCQQTCQYEDAQ